ncbi:Teneurin-1 [Phytophthora cinnamomi]|nr:Teneurin-1 [Phytophthora cinnamomi]
MQCPNDCSGHGTCEFIEELAADNFHKLIGGNPSITYALWDQEKIMGCVCDANFQGHDCSLRTCPKGDDPLTPNQFDMVQAIVISAAGGTGFLTYYDPYGNAYTTEKITFGAVLGTNDATTCANIQTALQRLPNNVLNTVSVQVATRFYAFTRADPTSSMGTGTTTQVYNDNGAGTQNKVICEIQFLAEPGTTGYQNLLDCNVLTHNDPGGQHPMSAGITGAGASTCEVYEVYPVNVDLSALIADGTTAYRPLTELVECSGRGSCDYTSGSCTCFAGHMGLACESQEALV